jgi:hypothetical protein
MAPPSPPFHHLLRERSRSRCAPSAWLHRKEDRQSPPSKADGRLRTQANNPRALAAGILLLDMG